MMTTAELLHALEVIAAGAVAATVEGQMLDFKASAGRSVSDTLRNVAEAIACLANAVSPSVDRRLGLLIPPIKGKRWGSRPVCQVAN